MPPSLQHSLPAQFSDQFLVSSLPFFVFIPSIQLNLAFNALLFLILRIKEIRSNHNQLILHHPPPQPNSPPLIIIPPPPPVLGLTQMQLLSRGVAGRQHQERIPVLAGAGRRARRLIRHDMLNLRRGIGVGRRQAEAGGDPVAHLAPAGVVAARRVRVRQGDRVVHLTRRRGRGVGGDADGRCVLQGWWVERVAEIGGAPGLLFGAARPCHVQQQCRQEVVDYGGDYFGAY